MKFWRRDSIPRAALLCFISCWRHVESIMKSAVVLFERNSWCGVRLVTCCGWKLGVEWVTLWSLVVVRVSSHSAVLGWSPNSARRNRLTFAARSWLWWLRVIPSVLGVDRLDERSSLSEGCLVCKRELLCFRGFWWRHSVFRGYWLRSVGACTMWLNHFSRVANVHGTT